MPAESPAATTGKRKRRAGVACDFCRQRKLGCDNEKPKCENCRFQDKECTYSERAKRIRPTNYQIQHLEEENEQLKISLSRLQSQVNNDKDQVRDVRNHGQDNGAVDETDGTFSAQDLSRLPVTPVSSSESLTAQHKTAISTSSSNPKPPYISTGDREVRFHGPSSAMFDESYQQSANTSTSSATADRSKRFELLGACIKQRQMEPIDLAAERLDFDGVDPELGMHLLSVFWNRQHALGSVVYRPVFMRDMACNGPYFSKILLNAIYFAAAKNSTRAEFRCARDAVTNDKDNVELPAIVSPFRRRAEELLSASISPGVPVPVAMKSEITTIQALLIMSDALFAWCDERSLSWLYSGLAINMIVDLGIHTGRETPGMQKGLSTEDVEVRRRLFWAAFVQDKVQSIYQGRPARLRGPDVNVPISFLDDYEELEQFDSLSYSASHLPTGFLTHGVSVFEQLCKLSLIADRILSSIYTQNYGEKNPSHLLETARTLHNDLERWRGALPEHLDMNLTDSKKLSLTPHSLSLMSMFYSLVILLHRPFVSDGHIRGTSSSVIRDAFSTCAAASAAIDSILRVFSQRFCITTVPYFMSYATYVSGTIHVRIAAQSARGSEAHQSLRNCLEVLSEQQGVCRAPRRARQILLRLARRLNVDIIDNVGILSSAAAIGLDETKHVASSRTRSSHTDSDETMISATTQHLDHRIPNTQSDFDLMMEGLDIDAIIQSFDFEQSAMTHADKTVNNEQQIDLPTPGPGSGVHDNALPGFQEADNLDEWSFQDPLFGYNSLFSDNTLMF